MENFNEKFAAYKDFQKLVGEAIGYGDLDCTIIDDYINDKWSIEDDCLTIFDSEDEEDYYEFTISSYSSKGEKLFCGAVNDLFLIMCYQDRWENADVLILKNENKL
jgi:hypothetical protein